MNTIGELTNRLRNQLKSTRQDAFLTDRFLYSMAMKHVKLFLRREDALNKLLRFRSAFQPLHYVELIDVDPAEADCRCAHTGCHIKRTRERLPKMFDGYNGPLIRSVSSLDYSKVCQSTAAVIWEQIHKQGNFKYNKHKYYWFLDGYLYLPNVPWDAIRVEAMFEDDISRYNCDTKDECLVRQDATLSVPEHLLSEIEALVIRDLALVLQLPSDQSHDLNHIAR